MPADRLSPFPPHPNPLPRRGEGTCQCAPIAFRHFPASGGKPYIRESPQALWQRCCDRSVAGDFVAFVDEGLTGQKATQILFEDFSAA